MNDWKRDILICAGLCLVTLLSDAVPARPGYIQRTDAEGNTYTVRLVGDENFHLYFTEDNYPLLEKDGRLNYGRVMPDGRIDDSGIEAGPIDTRPIEARNWLRNVDRASNETNFQLLKEIAATSRRKGLKGNLPQKAVADSPFTQGPGIVPGTTFPAYGRQKVLVVLVEFKDVKFQVENPSDYYARMLNEPGFSDYGATGSAADYYFDSSAGLFTPEFDVAGPVTLPKNESYYGGNDWAGNDMRPGEMVATACRMLEDVVDFSQYDRDGDGYVDNVYVSIMPDSVRPPVEVPTVSGLMHGCCRRNSNLPYSTV